MELLVQNGSDLNAQTKNHETPYGKTLVFTFGMYRKVVLLNLVSIFRHLRGSGDEGEDPGAEERAGEPRQGGSAERPAVAVHVDEPEDALDPEELDARQGPDIQTADQERGHLWHSECKFFHIFHGLGGEKEEI